MTSHAVAFAPGRANLIGEHTDYNQGLALPFAISEGVTVRARALAERRIDAIAVDLGERDSFSLDPLESADGWRAFVRGAAGELIGAGVKVSGAELEISGTVPRGAGLSSSAALEVALVMALLSVSGASEPDRLDLAKLCSRIENDWVGAQTGLLDQISSLFGESDRALRIDFRSLDVRPVELELDGCKLVTLDSGEHHAIAVSGYNERRAECAQACAELGVPSLRDVTLADADRLPAVLCERARHVITENERVDAAVAAVSRGDTTSLGRLLDESHASLRDCFEVSTPAVEEAVARLKRAGALGARIVGGGFGGHVLGLMPADAHAVAGALEVRPGDGARVTGS
ncbi:MAG TPA: galactokinase [Solirubrobacteraceae bacterium]|nr:galactokinase [Solirubrobacteraceae bacterium]